MTRNKILVKALVYIINGYQYLVGPILPRVCRFHPTCSEYSKQALLKYGAGKGLLLGIKRILRCNPFNAGGYDPII